MTGIILAAGRGGRLRSVAGNRPKCMLRVGEWTLIERQIRSLRECDIDPIVIVSGYGADQLRRTAGARIVFVHNERFASTNSLYSFWLARNWLFDGGVILNGDVLFHDRLLVDLLADPQEDALLVDAHRNGYTDEEMKVRIGNGRVLDIAKTLGDDEADGENVGIAKFGREGARALIHEVNQLMTCGGAIEWLPRAFAALCRVRPLHVVETRGHPWIEIDFPEDYWRACREVLPAIEATDGRRAAPDDSAPVAASGRGR